MTVEELVKKIQNERDTLKKEVYDADGLVRLQEAMMAYDGEYKLIWSDDLAKEIADRPKNVIHPTGIAELDAVIGGFKEQQLITLGGDTGHGKTTFGMFLVEKMESLNPLVIPLEQSNEELVEQRIERGYAIPKFLSPRSLAATVTVDWIEERIVEGIAKYNTKLVLLDHLGYINDFGKDNEFKRENAAYRIGQVMKSLKNIAKKWNVIIILLVHISQHDETKPPTRQDIKNSSDIAQESDMVGFVWRRNSRQGKINVYDNLTMLSIQKNRRTGRNANIGLEFNPTNGQYEATHASTSWIQSLDEVAQQNHAMSDEFGV